MGIIILLTISGAVVWTELRPGVCLTPAKCAVSLPGFAPCSETGGLCPYNGGPLAAPHVKGLLLSLLPWPRVGVVSWRSCLPRVGELLKYASSKLPSAYFPEPRDPTLHLRPHVGVSWAPRPLFLLSKHTAVYLGGRPAPQCRCLTAHTSSSPRLGPSALLGTSQFQPTAAAPERPPAAFSGDLGAMAACTLPFTWNLLEPWF